MAHVEVVEGDLLDQDVAVIVNAWNRNLIPWWLLLPQGISGEIKKKGGTAPFREVARHGPMPLGSAVLTSSGKLPFEGIIHVAGINLLWRASEKSIRDSVANAMKIVDQHRFPSVGFPLIGAGSGGFSPERAKAMIIQALEACDSPALAKVVVYKRNS
jgi:O-acetyl-ADP-ribose deacetylase (regulator of RNase III)